MPDSPYIRHDLGCALLYGGRFDDAADAFRQAIATDEKFALGHIKLAATLAEMARLMRRYALLDRPSEAEETDFQLEVITEDIRDLIDRAAALAAPEAKGEVLRETGKDLRGARSQRTSGRGLRERDRGRRETQCRLAGRHLPARTPDRGALNSVLPPYPFGAPFGAASEPPFLAPGAVSAPQRT